MSRNKYLLKTFIVHSMFLDSQIKSKVRPETSNPPYKNRIKQANSW